MALLRGHWQSDELQRKNLKQARAALERLYTALRSTNKTVAPAGGEAFKEAPLLKQWCVLEAYSVLFDMAREVDV